MTICWVFLCFMLNVTYAQSCIFYCYTECRHTEYRYAECRGTFLLTVKPFSACLNCCVKWHMQAFWACNIFATFNSMKINQAECLIVFSCQKQCCCSILISPESGSWLIPFANCDKDKKVLMLQICQNNTVAVMTSDLMPLLQMPFVVLCKMTHTSILHFERVIFRNIQQHEN